MLTIERNGDDLCIGQPYSTSRYLFIISDILQMKITPTYLELITRITVINKKSGEVTDFGRDRVFIENNEGNVNLIKGFKGP